LQATGLEDTIVQLKSLMEKDPTAFTNDETARALLDQLNEQIALMYADDEEDDDYDDEGERDGEGARPTTRGGDERASYDGSRLSGSRGAAHPRPVDLWKAAHETDLLPKQVCAPVTTASFRNSAANPDLHAGCKIDNKRVGRISIKTE
jgi:hypothetical protein